MHPAMLIRWVVVVAPILGACGDPTLEVHTVERARPVAVAHADASDEVEAHVDAEAEAEVDAEVATEVDEVATELDAEVATEVDADGPLTLPFVRAGDTRTSTRDAWDRYACAPDTDESGPEDVYVFTVSELGIVRARIDDVAGDTTDVDVHLLSGAGPESCVRRDNTALAWVVRPGTWTLVVDSWVAGDGSARAGAYQLDVSFVPLGSGRCAVDDVEQRMFWSACAPGPNALDCRDDGTDRFLRVPSLGPVVGEAHLVTVDEPFAGNGWPTALRDQIDRHYAISEAATGYVMTRDEPWAPEGEGGSHWGGGATGQKLPVLDEAWYVNMYWRSRPPRGRRMLVVEPWSGRAVVAAGGWETGPGSNTAIGGAVEEVHHHLQSGHRDDLVMAFLSDETLPLGPITCW